MKSLPIYDITSISFAILQESNIQSNTHLIETLLNCKSVLPNEDDIKTLNMDVSKVPHNYTMGTVL